MKPEKSTLEKTTLTSKQQTINFLLSHVNLSGGCKSCEYRGSPHFRTAMKNCLFFSTLGFHDSCGNFSRPDARLKAPANRNLSTCGTHSPDRIDRRGIFRSLFFLINLRRFGPV